MQIRLNIVLTRIIHDITNRVICSFQSSRAFISTPRSMVTAVVESVVPLIEYLIKSIVPFLKTTHFCLESSIPFSLNQRMV